MPGEPLSRTRREINNFSGARPVGCSPARCRVNPGDRSPAQDERAGPLCRASLSRTWRRTALPRAAGQHSPGCGEQGPTASSARQRCGVAAPRSACSSPEKMTWISDPDRDSAAVRWSESSDRSSIPACMLRASSLENFSDSESLSFLNCGPNRKLEMKPKHVPNSKSIKMWRPIGPGSAAASDSRSSDSSRNPNNEVPGPRP